jgi:hypothetical protein
VERPAEGRCSAGVQIVKSCGVAEPLCGKNVRQLALGLITYADGKRTFPPDPRSAPSRAITDAMGSYRWRSSREIVGANVFQRTPELADRRAHRVHHEALVHGVSTTFPNDLRSANSPCASAALCGR